MFENYIAFFISYPLSVMKAIFALIPLLLFAGCGKKESAATAAIDRPALTQVVGVKALEVASVYSGEVRARHEVAMGFRSSGKIIERSVEAGKAVKAGQILARLDPDDARLQAGTAEAQYQLAEAELKRYRELRSRGFVSQSALDVKEVAFTAAKSQLGLARNQSDYTLLRAEVDGVIAATLAEPGQVVSAGQPVVRLAHSGEIEVAIEIPEAQIAQRHIGDEAQVVIGTSGMIPARLRELSASADPLSRTYPARLSIGIVPGVALGMTAEVRFAGNSKQALLIPVSAVYQQGKNAAVWVVPADHRVVLRPVTILAYRDEGAVVGFGLAAGERIVSAGVHRLSAGEKIQITESAE